MKFEKNKWVNLSDPEQPSYIGRFAPSPTGPLHLGSLYTALAGFLDARAHSGQWLLRIDDLDTPRNVVGAADNILTTLEVFGLHWDGSEAYQSNCLDAYNDGLNQLIENQLLYPCFCSRKSLTEAASESAASDIYPGFCRTSSTYTKNPSALRVKTDARSIVFQDRLQGLIFEKLDTQHGDFVVKRKDQVIAYQFAVVIDDTLQNVSQVVRGTDLLESTAKQIYLQQLLGLPTPGYMHVPVIVDHQGYKLSKQTLASAVDSQKPESVLFELLVLLEQNPPSELKKLNAKEILAWAIEHWNPSQLKNSRTICQRF